jgi:integrase
MSIRKRQWKTSKGEEKTAWIVDYTDQSDTRRLKTFQRKKDADAFAANTHVAIAKGEHVADGATVSVAKAGELWLASATEAGLERTTVDQYRQHLNLHLAPFMGREKLSRLSVPLIRAFQDRLRDEGRSAAMVKRVTVSLGGILADAQERGLVARNVVREMSGRRTKGKARQGERRQKRKPQIGVDIPTRDEIRSIIENAEGRWRPFIVAAIFTGLRASELRGLRWSDVELEAGRLHVRQRADRYHVIGMPKTDAGQRTVPLSPMVANTLREWRLQCPKGLLDLVFPNGAGNVEWHANIIKRGLIPTQIAAGVTDGDSAKYTGLHALRHFYASWCINRRADGGLELPPKMVQERMGHSSITMTMDVYGHLFPSGDESEALAAAERDLLGAVNAT